MSLIMMKINGKARAFRSMHDVGQALRAPDTHEACVMSWLSPTQLCAFAGELVQGEGAGALTSLKLRFQGHEADRLDELCEGLMAQRIVHFDVQCVATTGDEVFEDAHLTQLLSALVHGGCVETLRLMLFKCGGGSAAALAELIRTAPALRSLALGNMLLGERGCATLLRAVRDLPVGSSLRELSVSAVHMRDSNVRALAEVLSGGCQLESLRLVHERRVTPPALCELVRAVGGNATLKTLGLLRMNLNAAVLEAMEDMVQMNRTLRKLDLHGCTLSTGFSARITRSLTQSRSPIECLCLSDVRQGEAALRETISGLRGNRWLCELDISGARIGHSTLVALTSLLPECTIETLTIQSFNASKAALDPFIEAIPRSCVTELILIGHSSWTESACRQLEAACALPKKGVVDGMVQFLLEMSKSYRNKAAPLDSSLARLGAAHLFDLNVITGVFQLVSGRRHRVVWKTKSREED